MKWMMCLYIRKGLSPVLNLSFINLSPSPIPKVNSCKPKYWTHANTAAESMRTTIDFLNVLLFAACCVLALVCRVELRLWTLLTPNWVLGIDEDVEGLCAVKMEAQDTVEEWDGLLIRLQAPSGRVEFLFNLHGF